MSWGITSAQWVNGEAYQLKTISTNICSEFQEVCIGFMLEYHVLVWWLSVSLTDFGFTSLALGQSYACPSASEATWNNMGKSHESINSLKPSDAYIWISKLTSIGPDNVLSPGWRHAIIWTNAGILLIGTLGINFSEILNEVQTFLFKKMQLKMSSAKWWQQGFYVVKSYQWVSARKT